MKVSILVFSFLYFNIN